MGVQHEVLVGEELAQPRGLVQEQYAGQGADDRHTAGRAHHHVFV
ncbi:hypothetical protein ACIF83_10470 [Streptomyces sp. NPDC085866]